MQVSLEARTLDLLPFRPRGHFQTTSRGDSSPRLILRQHLQTIPPRQRLMELLKSWRQAPFRRSNNVRGARQDAACSRFAARLLLLYSVLYLLLTKRQPGLALVNIVYALMLEGVAAAIPRWSRLYVSNREVAVTLAQVVQAVVLLYTVINGSGDEFNTHHGSRFKLLGLLLAGAPFFVAVSTLHTRLLLSWNVFALPLLALLPLSQGHRLCRQVLGSPGVELPLSGLFQLLD